MAGREKYVLKDYPKLKGEVKVAILFKVLGEDLALTMFKGKITESKLLKVKNRSRRIEYVAPALQRLIVEQYYNSLLAFETPQPSSKGKEEKELPKKPDFVYNKIFAFLNDLTSEQIFYLIAEEKPSIKAIILEQLDSNDKMTLMKKFPQKERQQIMIEIAQISNIPLDAVINVANEIEKNTKNLAEPTEYNRGGKNAVGNMLRSLSEAEAVEFLNEIKSSNPGLYEQVKRAIFTFEDLLNAPDETREKIWTEILGYGPIADNLLTQKNTLSLAFKGIDEEIYEKNVITMMTNKQAAMYDKLEDTPINKNEVEDARQQLRKYAYELIEQNKFSIDDIFEAEMVE